MNERPSTYVDEDLEPKPEAVKIVEDPEPKLEAVKIVEDPEPEPEAVKINEDSEPKAPRNFFDQLPIEIVHMILELAIVNQDVITFNAVHNTCSRFRPIIKEKQNDILPRVCLDFYDNVLVRLPRRGNKIKVSVNKLSRHFGPNSGAIDDVSKAIGNKNCRSAWLLIKKRKYRWFVIDRVFWKEKKKVNTIQEPDMVIDAHPDEWLHDRMYILTEKDKEVLLSKDEWLNDQLMDAAQNLICEEIGTPFTFQTVLNSQKKFVEPCRAVYEKHPATSRWS